jgi:hypothetical protein
MLKKTTKHSHHGPHNPSAPSNSNFTGECDRLNEENISSMKTSYKKIRKGEDMITSLNNGVSLE